ncbi:UDP-N-acetylglucosamine 2-epimerase [Paenibacillus sp.]|uniref:UDP-N-acetylglucosamine 2-epimerase n=1 Tax=Paenibacillus sp. TaxID=58172 RepID=UPI002D4EE1BE|nr:UDP-N-acetylglucosamine 2-epimerase [Paenibacillus sp.]HZG87398.1 UDP-N-acetylglucosamine 2-epimerase [Paenibacillus sp.]
MKRRKICIITGTRAEYGLLFKLMSEVQSDSDLELQIIATGMHLSPEFGLTYRLIEQDGFRIDEKVEMLMSSDSPVGIAKSIGLGTIGFADAFQRLAPDVIVMLGDRYEILAAAQAAMTARIPIAHIHGGELTEGLIDEAIRHSVTKMAHLHFTSAEPYRRRVIQLGEHPSRVYNVGAPGLDYIRDAELMTRTELERELGMALDGRLFLVTYHPVTLAGADQTHALEQLLQALDHFPEARIVFTKSNSDTHGRVINERLERYAADRSERAKVFTNLGQRRYLSVLKAADAVIGNSSSGIIEAPFLKTPTVNIGERQSGRLRAPSVLDAADDANEIVRCLRTALDDDFRSRIERAESIFGDGTASRKMKEILKSAELEGIVFKRFYDLEVN